MKLCSKIDEEPEPPEQAHRLQMSHLSSFGGFVVQGCVHQTHTSIIYKLSTAQTGSAVCMSRLATGDNRKEVCTCELHIFYELGNAQARVGTRKMAKCLAQVYRRPLFIIVEMQACIGLLWSCQKNDKLHLKV